MRKDKPPLRRTMIREWRKFRGLTQEQLASAVGVSAANLSRIETGKQGYTQAVLEAIATTLRCEPADLLTARDPGEPESAILLALRNLPPEQRNRALRVVQALGGDEAA